MTYYGSRVEHDAQRLYNEGIVKAAEAGKAFMEEWPQLSFLFNTNSEGGLNLGSQPPATVNIVAKMDEACDGLSLSSINVVFDRLKNEAVEAGRRVTRYKIGSQHITEISPVVS